MGARTVPTPRDVAAHHTPSAVLAPRPGTFDRDRWEAAVLASELPRFARHLALVLAHHADASGLLPAGGTRHEAGRLAADMRLDVKRVRLTLTELEMSGWIHRPNIHAWDQRNGIRPITLTLPARALQAPPSTGGADA